MLQRSNTLILGGELEGIVQVHTTGCAIAAASDAGFGLKDDKNEDRVALVPDRDFAAVIDGVTEGGLGAPAAQMHAEELIRTPWDIPAALERAHRRMLTLPGHAGVRITTAQILREHGRPMAVESYQSGDVRLILDMRKTFLEWLWGLPAHVESKDDNLMQEWIDQEKITRRESRVHPLKHRTTRNLNTKHYVPAIRHVYPVDRSGPLRVMLHSDGVIGNLDTDEIVELGKGKTARELLELLWQVTEQRMKQHIDHGFPRDEDSAADHRSSVVMDVRDDGF